MSVKKWLIALAGTVLAIVVAIGVIQQIVDSPDATPAELPSSGSSNGVQDDQSNDSAIDSGDEALVARSDGPPAPNFAGIVRWLNSNPLSMEELGGKVVLVDFWTYSCINCLRTLPYLRDWNEKYASRGLEIVGVHSPEFEFEKSEANVREAIAREQITWAVAMDNDFQTWQAYQNRYWPHKFLIDQDGYIRYDHIGEGAYEETELQIRKLLAEAGREVSDIPVGGVAVDGRPRARTTRELYMGSGWWQGGYLGNEDSTLAATGESFFDSSVHEEGRFYLQGVWDTDSESVRHARATEDYKDYVAIKYRAASVNVVVRPQGSEPFKVVTTMMGKPLLEEVWGDDIQVDEEGRTYFQVDMPRLYNVIRGAEVWASELELRVKSTDFVLYTFTFGA